MQTLHFPLEALHATYHGIEGGNGCVGVLTGERGVGGGFDGGDDDAFFVLNMLLDSLKILSDDLMGQS